MSRNEVQKKLLQYGDRVVSWGYSEIVKNCRQNNAIPVWVFLPTLEGIFNEDDRSVKKLKKEAEAAGFIVISLENVFKDFDKEKLWVAPWDMHPNSEGHKLIADLLYKQLLKKQNEIKLNF
ncbi:MAG: SGNH/GDSL hydrolase family protein [Ignavibacteriales bacterium]|nr:SGNH/GDSL hydrolase family protein [Ignavibacteriales bacterium]